MVVRKRVVVIERVLSHYRRRFFEELRARLVESAVELELIYGMPDGKERLKKDAVDIPWAHRIQNYRIRVGSKKLFWQPCVSFLRRADLVIVEQANKCILNYLLLLAQIGGLIHVCFWGHGKDFQADKANEIGEILKRIMSRRVHWWFAYNDLSAAVVKRLGYPEERITSVQNAIDTRELVAAQEHVQQDELDCLKSKLGIRCSNMCIFVGAMYPDKRLRFLIDACRIIKSKVLDFEMIFIGSGEDSHIIEAAAASFDWVRYPGPVFGMEKVPYFMLSKLCLMPGAVGLAILDAFAMETPLITTDVHSHGPEICYLQHGKNGIVVANKADPSTYAQEVVRFLLDDNARNKLVAGCIKSRSIYSIEQMADNFAQGVISCLSQE